MAFRPIRFIPDDTKIPFMLLSRFGFFVSGHVVEATECRCEPRHEARLIRPLALAEARAAKGLAEEQFFVMAVGETRKLARRPGSAPQ